MKTVVCTRYGGPEVLHPQEVPKPTVKNKELLVKIMATAVNSGDVRVRGLAVEGFVKVIMRLVLGISKPRKPILGTVFSGVVEEVGKQVTHFKPGDEVFGVTGFGFGTYAEYIRLKAAGNVVLKPKNATFEEAAAILFGGQTALYFLERAGITKRINPRILIIGGTGSVGTAAIQIAAHYQATITVVCSSDGHELVNRLGASSVILYDKADFTKSPAKFDIIFDAVGKTNKKQCIHLLNPGGVYKTVGGLEYASETKEQLIQLKELFEEGTYNPVIDKIFSLEEMVEAHRYVDSGRKKGNVVVTIGG